MKQEKIGPKIKELRESRGMTQQQFAESLGYSGKSVIAHIEKGDADMTYEKILLLLRTYALDANDLFEVERIDSLLKESQKKKKDKVVVYIHGLHSSHNEAEDYQFLNKQYDVIGLEYEDGDPWIIKDDICNKFKKITKGYKSVVVIANSIGAFYTYHYLNSFKIEKAFFISPIASMSQIILNIMMEEGIHLKELEEKKFIKTKSGQTLSSDFYKEVEKEDSWDVPTHILYGSQDDIVYIENIADFLSDHPNTLLTIKKGSGHYFHTEEEKEFIKNWIIKYL